MNTQLDKSKVSSAKLSSLSKFKSKFIAEGVKLYSPAIMNKNFYNGKSVQDIAEELDSIFRSSVPGLSLICCRENHPNADIIREDMQCEFLDEMTNLNFYKLALILLNAFPDQYLVARKIIIYGYSDKDITKIYEVIKKYSPDPNCWRLDNLKAYYGNLIPQIKLARLFQSSNNKVGVYILECPKYDDSSFKNCVWNIKHYKIPVSDLLIETPSKSIKYSANLEYEDANTLESISKELTYIKRIEDNI